MVILVIVFTNCKQPLWLASIPGEMTSMVFVDDMIVGNNSSAKQANKL